MAYTSGFLKDRVTVQNRTTATEGARGLDSAGIGWEDTVTLWASVDWVRGKRALSEGAIDVYGVVMVRMRWTNEITARSRIVHNGTTYQILADTFHADYNRNTIQFQAQQVQN